MPYFNYTQQQNPLNQYYQSQVKPLSQKIQGAGTLGSHMSNLMGGMRTASDDYVKRAAGAGIQRGGMNVAGGSPLASQLALQATKGLASNYGTTYGQAAQYANQDRASTQNLLSQMMSGITSSGGYGWGGGGYGGNSQQGRNGGYSSDELQQRARDQEYADQLARRARGDSLNAWQRGRQAENQADADASRQRQWSAEDRSQSQQDANTQRYQQGVQWDQSQDQYRQNQKVQDAAYDANYAAQQRAKLAQTSGPQFNPNGQQSKLGLGAASSAAIDPNRAMNQEQSSYQQLLQRQQMQQQLAEQAEKLKQTQMQTKLGGLNVSGEEFKQNEWLKQYLSNRNAGGSNPRLGQAIRSAIKWGQG